MGGSDVSLHSLIVVGIVFLFLLFALVDSLSFLWLGVESNGMECFRWPLWEREFQKGCEGERNTTIRFNICKNDK